MPVELDFGKNDSNMCGKCLRRHAGATAAADVFAFTTEMDTRVFIDTSGSTFDTVLAIRTECESIESELSCDDDGGDSFQSRVEFLRGRVYILRHCTWFEETTRCDSIDLWDSP